MSHGLTTIRRVHNPAGSSRHDGHANEHYIDLEGDRQAPIGHFLRFPVKKGLESLTKPLAHSNILAACRGSSVVEQGTHKPLVAGSTPALGTPTHHPVGFFISHRLDRRQFIRKVRHPFTHFRGLLPRYTGHTHPRPEWQAECNSQVTGRDPEYLILKLEVYEIRGGEIGEEDDHQDLQNHPSQGNEFSFFENGPAPLEAARQEPTHQDSRDHDQSW